MSKHTPGPWRVERPEDELINFGPRHVIGAIPTVKIWADSARYASSFYHEIALVAENDEANARLIAAAPDLLEAAKLGVDLIQAWMDGALRQLGARWESEDKHPPALLALRAAIKKATEAE